MSDESESGQAEMWSKVHDHIASVMCRFGTEDHLGRGDYLIVDDNHGWNRNTIEVHSLHMLQPVIVKSLQRVLKDAPKWEIVIAV
ncbi:MAG TPA: hypothetical protein VGO69_01020, partial [Pyrinomonadaceae bacterium]|nr:hypothetical protein [Pyrinomonadaceae bacterium]